MSGEETLELYVTLGVWGLTFLAAVKALGVRRALWGLALLVLSASRSPSRRSEPSPAAGATSRSHASLQPHPHAVGGDARPADG